MTRLIEPWEAGTHYEELNLIRFFDKCKMLINPDGITIPDGYTESTLPAYPEEVRNKVMEFSNGEFIGELIAENPDLNVDTLGLWKEL